ncbi:hypothetical protein [Humidisolicoccus flavus]|uniref:hypothetical protein n=1 Tax=Humidisolicoccus flavus TaxID=3111414 RepID=UPI00324E1134
MSELQWIEKTKSYYPEFIVRTEGGKHYVVRIPNPGEQPVAVRTVPMARGTVAGAHPDLGEVYQITGSEPFTFVTITEGKLGEWALLGGTTAKDLDEIIAKTPGADNAG